VAGSFFKSISEDSSPAIYSTGQFSEIRDQEAAKELFKSHVEIVHIEISSYCNRRCSYCPVSTVDRLSSINYMDNEIFLKILNELSLIEYDGFVSLALFNEPTHDREYLLWRMRLIQKYLKKAKVYFHSNGDYLDGEFLKTLADYGLKSLYITLHLPKDAVFDQDKVTKRFDEFQKRIGVPLQPRQVTPNVSTKVRFTIHGIECKVLATNYADFGQTRAGLMENVPVRRERAAPCQRPFAEVPISYDGSIRPCCHMFADSPAHAPYKAGSLRDSSLYEIYASKLMAGFRRELFRFGPKKSPCNVCTEEDRPGSPAEIKERDALYARFIAPLTEAERQA
jgi:MoaA/NifB/PqqE/SkfB family radical SAM enzyme